MPPILLLDKPRGMTSAKAVERVKRALGAKKVGHGGTLDPLATGLLIIGINEGTKRLTEYLKLPKTYEAEILLGECRSTGDLEGEIVETADVPQIPREDIEEALKSMEGTLTLPVSAYSALKRDGEPLYKKARRGEEVEPPLRDMEVREAKLYDISYKFADKKMLVKVVFDVGSGTYIRSLAEELGKRLGYPATLANLRRTKIGEFDIKDAKTLDQLL